MQAIQTHYKGYHFRSRLEARWAVFFDALGISWEYEPEGFDLGGGVRYLPDFKIGDIYVEVKPKAGSIEQFEKAMLMSRYGVMVIGVGGPPDTLTYPVFENGMQSMDVAINGDWKYGPFFWCVGTELWGDWYAKGLVDSGETRIAANKARSARFEFGQSGVAA